ncbi:zincin-like metallopeptidase toxin domain-containing protein [Niallia circulans]|uniref:zincin-like metallopeptidase toxin domain-containing protein n=1 Tax=Niallia circulans TaxID=1397 RepID=UPI00201DDCFF|nr:zincin-like metallopeptidase toxin domain-containing protein [Niallia circulans]
MKRDLKINYGILDQIIEQLHTYKRALLQMQTSLHTIAGYTERNAGKSLEAWEDLMQESKKTIKSYQTQIEDLLTLFENYVADTTAYITPISRNSMMRVDRNDIWGNLTQIEWGVTYRLSRAIQETYRSPSLLFSLFDDTDLEERERSRYNKQQLESIRNNMESVQSRLKNKMEELWDLYESKVKKYENTDDEYANKASQVKDRYTTFSEKVSDVISVTAEGAWDFVKGLAVAIYEIAKGLITLVIDAGIVAASGIIPDSIEPDFLKKASTKRIESATETLDAIIHDPTIVLESMAQSITDTAEKEGIMYVSGSAATSFLPYVGQAKYLKLLKVEKSKNKTNGIRSAISQKTTESLQRIDGSKKENSLWPNGIKNSGKQYVQEVTHFFRQNFMPNPSFQLSTANQAPVNVWSRATIENRMDSIVPVSLRKVEGKGTTKGTGKIDYVEETGRLGGKHYSEKDLKLLGNYLEKRGVTLKVGDEFLPPGKGGGFNYNTGELVLKSNPTQYEVWHELSHYIQYKQIGKEAYSNLPRTSGPVPMNDLTKFNAPEQFVYDMLSNNPKRWNSLNEAEQLHANWYITQYGGIR